MKRIVKHVVTAMALALVLTPVVAQAAPNINGAKLYPRVFNDCPGSTFLGVNNYPASIFMADYNPNCFGFANLHNWRLSDDGGAGAAIFHNGDAFRYCADLVLSGPGNAEAGLNVAPWWSVSDGRLNVRVPDGEIAAFGGRLPFFSFTGTFGITYIQGTPIRLEIIYLPNGLSQASPATITYNVTYGGFFSSGPLPFDQGNPAEDPPHGQWGILTPASVGGHFQFMLGNSGPDVRMTAEWLNHCYENLGAIPTKETTWGNIKALYND
jgi:hypothetical protein